MLIGWLDSISQTKTPDPGPSESPSDTSTSEPVADTEADAITHEAFFHAATHSPASLQLPDMSFREHQLQQVLPFDMSTPPYLRPIARPFEANSVTSPLDSLFEDTNFVSPPAGRSGMSGQSPRLIDLLLPGSELNARPSDLGLGHIQPFDMPVPFQPEIKSKSIMDEDVEEIIRQPHMSSNDPWVPSYGSHIHSGYSSRSGSPTIYRQPEVQAGSPEMLMLRYDKQTCGILSVKDGPTENPWRTLIWPLVRESTALYHAIASMTAFHHAREKPALRVDGMEHMRRSIRSLATGIGEMRTDIALATTLVLAFSESWDQHISTGIEHLRGARILVNQALVKHRTTPLGGDDLARLKFLCNTWIYMDVIARLTSVDDDDSTDFDNILLPLHGPFGKKSTDIDPLMGCATTLFPLIGRAANLCRKVQTMKSNSIAIISQAIELKEQIERWQTASATDLEDPEDPSCDIQHALQTAEAYRYATLLYLHQAVPEIPSLTSAQLAQMVLKYLATVPLSSRAVIVQIYPLLAAGCEAYDSEDRKWVENRWLVMSQRMWIGNIDKCWIVTQEVWDRRDKAEAAKEAAKMTQRRPMMMHSECSKLKFEEEQMEDLFSFSDMLNGTNISGSKKPWTSFSGMQSGPSQAKKKNLDPMMEQMDSEMTVRGSLHWVGVMKEWGWEGQSTPLLPLSTLCHPSMPLRMLTPW
jgi:Fungal specific transcription factor domain